MKSLNKNPEEGPASTLVIAGLSPCSVSSDAGLSGSRGSWMVLFEVRGLGLKGLGV